MNPPNRNEWIAPTAEPMTAWTNPTSHPISFELAVPANISRVVVDDLGIRHTIKIDHEMRRVTFATGETQSLPSKYDGAIHILTGCGHPGCKNAICRDPSNAGPRAMVNGGLAPLLQREGQRYGVDRSLVTRAAPPRSVAIAPGDVVGKLAALADEDPAIARARARKAASK